jgi:hypothetical protein
MEKTAMSEPRLDREPHDDDWGDFIRQNLVLVGAVAVLVFSTGIALTNWNWLFGAG